MTPDGPNGSLSELEERLKKLAKINAALMNRVERSMDQQGNAYSLFNTAIGLENQVRVRTEELNSVLENLAHTNEELIQARDASESANRFKTRFFTAVGHDLLQPLHAARLSLSALSESENIDEHQRLSIQIDHALSTIEQLLSTILDLSKLEAGVMQPAQKTFRLEDLFRALCLDLEPLARKRGLKLSWRATDVDVISDALMLRRILQNLLANAVRYTTSGRILLCCRRRDDVARIEIWDTGPGIAREETARIFEEFERGAASQHATGSGGFGLGLSIVQRMAQTLGHKVDVCSRLGLGTRFSVQVPLSSNTTKAQPDTVAPARRQPAYGFDANDIVVIENDPTVKDAMCALLTRWSCEAWPVASLDELDELMKTPGFAADIVLADFHLDNDELGITGVQRLRAWAGSELPAIVITADRTPAVSNMISKARCELLYKPIKPAELRALMLHVLGAAGPNINA